MLRFDKSCNFWYRLFHPRFLYYRFPVVYSDGRVSKFKLHFAERAKEPLGILCQGYIIMIKPVPEPMTEAKMKKYCKNTFIFGRDCCLPPRSVMKHFFKHASELNEVIEFLKGKTIENKWYMVQNDNFGAPASGGWKDKEMVIGLHPQISDKGNGVSFDEDAEVPFYPAVKI